jgi:hypothetical protein
MHRLLTRRETVRAASLCLALGLSVTTALAQDQGVRELEHYREVAPSEEIPELTTRTVTVKPESELDLGFTRLHAYLNQRVLYDDNVYLSKHDTTSDTELVTNPGIMAQSFFGDHRLSVSYSPTRRTYDHETQLDDWDHLANADLRLDFVDSYVRVSDSFERTHETRDIRFPGRVTRDLNDAQVEAGILHGYLGLGILGENRIRTYGEEVPAYEDFTENGIKLFARYAQSADHAWLLEYGAVFRDFRDNVLNDSTTNTVLGGLEISPRDDVHCLVKAGPVWVESDHDGSVDDDSDLFDVAAEAEVSADLTHDVSARVFYVQRPEYATFSNYQKVYRGGLGSTWKADKDWLTVTGQVFAEKANPSNQDTLSLIGTGIAVDADLNHWCKVGVGWEWRRRLGTGGLDYEQNQFYVQAVIYF